MKKIKLKRSISRFIKIHILCARSAFIEKHAMQALNDSFTDLTKRLDQEPSDQIDDDPSMQIEENDESHERPCVSSSSSIPLTNRKSEQRNSKVTFQTSIENSNLDEQRIIQQRTNPSTSVLPITSQSQFMSDRFLVHFSIITLCLLIIFNLFLYMKLNHIDQMTDRLIRHYPSWLENDEHLNENDRWSFLLKRQEEFYQSQLLGLQAVLTSTHEALKNVTDALNEISNSNKRFS